MLSTVLQYFEHEQYLHETLQQIFSTIIINSCVLLFHPHLAGFRSALSTSEHHELATDAITRFSVSMVAAVLHYRRICLQQVGTVSAWHDAGWTVGDMKASLTLVWRICLRDSLEQSRCLVIVLCTFLPVIILIFVSFLVDIWFMQLCP